jgi:carboxyl-terminal processing protease
LGNQPLTSNADYQDFKQYLKAQNISFDTETELALKNTLWWPRKNRRHYYYGIPTITCRITEK